MMPFASANIPADGEPWTMIIERHEGKLDLRTNILDRRNVVASLRAWADAFEGGDRGLDVRQHPPTPST